MNKIAILGFGVVGSGVFEVISRNVPGLCVARVLDRDDAHARPSFAPIAHVLTKNYQDILDDSEIGIVVETLGGCDPAFEYVKAALLRGKSVATSNKELVAAHGAELLAIAKAHGVNFLLEASVGGGIPIIDSFKSVFLPDRVFEITGILNGTTNYILTQMSKNGISYDDALKQAQALGFAEMNPVDDVNGFDAGRKLAILLSLATGRHVYFSDIPTTGITGVSFDDIQAAKARGRRIKLIAHAKVQRGESIRIIANVQPVEIDETSPLFGVDNEFNAIVIKSDMLGETMLYGKGAGRLPTASAVVSDVLRISQYSGQNISPFWSQEKLIIEV
ncbi:MAG: homoserine dehydrogenase [Defluviitaleaceae bacterium]|nr:homoserine dehydrogenase [Defluviitaleaceae bacterium]